MEQPWAVLVTTRTVASVLPQQMIVPCVSSFHWPPQARLLTASQLYRACQINYVFDGLKIVFDRWSNLVSLKQAYCTPIVLVQYSSLIFGSNVKFGDCIHVCPYVVMKKLYSMIEY